MDERIKLFQELAKLFENNGHSLYLVGGSVRDYLLNIPLTDMDLVTDATPREEKSFLKDADYTFEKFGSIKLKYKDVKFDITTLRKETKYLDSRHPSEIIFTNKLEEDVFSLSVHHPRHGAAVRIRKDAGCQPRGNVPQDAPKPVFA